MRPSNPWFAFREGSADLPHRMTGAEQSPEKNHQTCKRSLESSEQQPCLLLPHFALLGSWRPASIPSQTNDCPGRSVTEHLACYASLELFCCCASGVAVHQTTPTHHVDT